MAKLDYISQLGCNICYNNEFLLQMFEILTESSIFKGLNASQIKELIGKTSYYFRSYNPGEVVALAEEPCDNLIIVVEGNVKGEMVDFSGKVIKIEDRQAPQAIAAAFLFGRNNVFPVNVEATVNTALLFIPRNGFMKMLQVNEVVLKNYLDAISSRSQFLSNKIKFLSFKTIKGKIAQYILKLAGEKRERVSVPHTQQDLAELFGVTRPSLARAMGELEQEGVLRIERKEVVILDRERLREMVR